MKNNTSSNLKNFFKAAIEKVATFLGAEVDLNVQDKHGRTALHDASRAGHFETVKFRLEKGADINVQDENGQTALYDASRAGHFETVKFLLEKGADINVQDENGQTALHNAIRDKTYFEMVKLLLEKGADVNAKSKYGTALHFASRAGHLKRLNLCWKKRQMLMFKIKMAEQFYIGQPQQEVIWT